MSFVIFVFVMFQETVSPETGGQFVNETLPSRTASLGFPQLVIPSGKLDFKKGAEKEAPTKSEEIKKLNMIFTISELFRVF